VNKMTKDEKVRVLGVVGSPRRGGNTEALVDEVLRGAEEAGGHAEKAVLSEMNVQPCRACDVCRHACECVIQDDMAALIEQMRDSRVWVLGTPVYWWGPTAQMKAFIDRWYGLDRALFRGRDVVLVIPSGGGPSYARLTVEMLESIVPYLGMKHIRTLQAPGSSGLGSVRRDTALMKRAWSTGHEAVKGLRG
jgi:multimeric flavodoxin WrbA